MNKFEVIGNLGADAEVKTENGKKFVSLSIADTRRRKKEDGTVQESTVWVSATINGDGGNLLPYLVKGVKVWASGEMTVRTYHSEKQRALVAGINLFVRDIELVDTKVDDVPRDVYDVDGVAHRVSKFYHTDTVKNVSVYDRQGREFKVDGNGWIFAVQATPADTTATNQPETEETKTTTKNTKK